MNIHYLVPLILCCAYAFIRGAAPERLGMGIVAANAILSYALVSSAAGRFQDVEFGIFAVDVAAFCGFIPLALRANRYWPIWVAALLGLGLLGHLAMMLRPLVIPWAYAVVLSMWSYPILALIAAGTHAHRRRLKRTGADPSWTLFSAPPGPTGPGPGPTG